MALDVCVVDFIEFRLPFKVKASVFVFGKFSSFQNLDDHRLSRSRLTKDKDHLFAFDDLLDVVVILHLAAEE